MSKKFLSLALALVMSLGLTVPAFAVESNWNLEVLGKSDAEVFVGEKTFTLRDWVWSEPDDQETYTLTKGDSRQGTAENLCVVSAGEVVAFTNGGESFKILDVTAWSDPDGDGVYDMRLYNFYGNYEMLPANTAGPLRSGDTDNYGDIAALYTDRTLIHMVSMGYLNFVGISEYPEYGYIEPFADCGIDPVTELKLRVDDILTLYGPNTLLWITPEGLDDGWAVLVEGNITQPTVPTVGGFTDVLESDYFAEPVLWAVKKGITAGTSDTTFSPDQDCTVAQILSFLWRANGSPKPTGSNPFSDVNSGDYYADAAVWAYEKGLVSGAAFGGDTPCTRSMAVTYMWKAAGSPGAGTSDFTDVPANADYAQAVAWALEQGVTAGTSDTTFSPDDVCSRGQIVSFLHRELAK